MPTGRDGVSDAAQQGACEHEYEISLLELLTIIARRRRMIGKTVLAAIAVGVLFAVLTPNRYTATTSLLPPQQPQSLSTALAAQLGGGMLGAVAARDLGLKNPNDVYIGMLKSRVVADAIIQRFDLVSIYRDKRVSDARKNLQKATDVALAKDGFITVSVEDKDRRRAADMANAYVDELRKLTSTLAVTEAGQRRLFFEQQLQKAKGDLAQAEYALKSTQEKTGLIQLDSQAKAIIESVSALRAQIASKEVQLQAMQAFASERNPDVVVARQQLASLRVELAKLEHQSNAGGGDIQVPTGSVPAAGLEFARHLRDVKYYETIFELLAKQYEAAKLDEAREGAVIQVVDPAVVPDRKSSPSRMMIVLLAAVGGLLGAAIWAVVSEAFERVSRAPEASRQVQALRRLFALARS